MPLSAAASVATASSAVTELSEVAMEARSAEPIPMVAVLEAISHSVAAEAMV